MEQIKTELILAQKRWCTGGSRYNIIFARKNWKRAGRKTRRRKNGYLREFRRPGCASSSLLVCTPETGQIDILYGPAPFCHLWMTAIHHGGRYQEDLIVVTKAV